MRSLSDDTLSKGMFWTEKRVIAAGKSNTNFTAVDVVMSQIHLVKPVVYIRLLLEDKAMSSLQKIHSIKAVLKLCCLCILNK